MGFSLDDGLRLTVNTTTLINTWLIMIILIVFSIIATYRLKKIPNPIQRVMEIYVAFMDKLVKDTLETTSRSYLPLVGTLFIFLLSDLQQFSLNSEFR